MEENAITYFVGEFTHSLDTKGRLTIPSKWRIPGGDNTYLALPNPDGCITVYPPKMVARLEENMGGTKLSDVRRRALSMELFSRADSFGCDKQGRINLSESLLHHAGIKGKAILAGNFTDYSIWSEARYVKRKKSSESVNIFDAMRELGL
jgi:MraZ protein